MKAEPRPDAPRRLRGTRGRILGARIRTPTRTRARGRVRDSAAQEILDGTCVARGANVRRPGDQADLKRSGLRIPYRVKKGKKRLIPGD